MYFKLHYISIRVLHSEAAAHAVATLAEATLQGGGQIVLAETAAAVGALAGVQDATGTHSPMMSPAACRNKIFAVTVKNAFTANWTY